MKILSIAGSDPSSGAGIQSDIKTFSALGAYGFTVITSITSQNTKKFSKIEPISPKMIRSQIESIFSDFSLDAIKIGMVYNSSSIKTIYSKLKGLKIPIVVDPVLKSTTGGQLIKKNALSHYKKFLIPLADVITPNVFEAEKLTCMKIKNKKDLGQAAQKIMKMGAKSVIITGIDFERGKISDYIFKNSKSQLVSGKKLPIINHGSGCNFSAALTVEIAKGNDLYSSAKFAKEYAYNSIKKSQKIGQGLTISKTISKKETEENSLTNAIAELQKLKKIHSLIPECQTNFVLSKPNAKSIQDVLGVQGRIVKAGKNLVLAGDLKYGGSKHVASAVLEIRKKFPKITSAINLKYNLNTIKNSKKKGFVIKSYNRVEEPPSIKNKENSSVSWGIKNAIINSSKSPDIIFHKGDLGKEPMILVFGKTPEDVIQKVAKIL